MKFNVKYFNKINLNNLIKLNKFKFSCNFHLLITIFSFDFDLHSKIVKFSIYLLSLIENITIHGMSYYMYNNYNYIINILIFYCEREKISNIYFKVNDKRSGY